jgi:adenylate kinase
MRLLLIGPPGSGKGTQAKVIAEHFGIVHLSSGDLLRQHIEDQTPVGRSAADIVARGDLVPDDMVLEVVRDAIEQASRHGGYVLDGYPRTADQAAAADRSFSAMGAAPQVALSLDVAREQLIERMRRRGETEGRTDDTEAVMRHRLDVYEEVTPPLLDYMAQHAILLRVDGSRSIDEVSAAILDELERARARMADTAAWP